MKYFFEDEKNLVRLKKCLDEWIGTPYRHRCGVKGRGCDCIHFVSKILEELGILIWRKDLIPDYPRDWHIHHTRELLMESLIKEVKVEEVSIYDLRDGDIILSHYGKAAAHASFYYKNHVYQSVDRIGVICSPLSDPIFRRQMKHVFRVLV
jgi:cell wall-associated NlpC family hydrolase